MFWYVFDIVCLFLAFKSIYELVVDRNDKK